MVSIIKDELLFEKSLKKKNKFICEFCNTTIYFILIILMIYILSLSKKI